MNTNIIYNEECISGMNRIPDKSIDMILCDLPYGTTRCSWDSIIPFDKLWLQYERIIKNNGVILLTGSEPFSTILRMSNISLYKYDWYWAKSKPSFYQHAKNRPLKKIETISVFSKAKVGHKSQISNRIQYNPQGVIEDKIKTVNHNYHGNITGSRNNQIGKEYMAYTGFPHDLLEFQSVTGKYALHPTQKPVELFEYLIKTYTNEGDIVLDNCIGSGTTAIACINTNRKYIGFETSQEYYEIAQNRINTILNTNEP